MAITNVQPCSADYLLAKVHIYIQKPNGKYHKSEPLLINDLLLKFHCPALVTQIFLLH